MLPPCCLLSDAQVNILPSVMSCSTQLEAATLQLYHLEVILLCRNLLGSQLTQLRAEGHKCDAISIEEGTALECFTCLFVDKGSYFHSAVRLGK